MKQIKTHKLNKIRNLVCAMCEKSSKIKLMWLQKKTQQHLLSGFFALCLVILISTTSAFSQADSPCDPQYYNSLKSRAWLEAQREITQNQNLIYKPDSVFEYTCFDQFVNELADHAEDMFSETNRWGDVPGVNQRTMDTALDDLVGDALLDYIAENFEYANGKPYDLLGGRLNDEGIDYNPRAIDGDGDRKDYDCDMMNQVWMAAKCMNFIDDEDHDGFYTFEEYRDSEDHRFLPSQCAALSSKWTTEVNASTGTNTPWTEDLVKTFLEKLDPQNCGNAVPVPTGVTVYRAQQSPTSYDEKICIMPGCYYIPSGQGRCSTSP